MKIYAIRDRLLDYYQQPFIAHDDKPVMAAISNQLHNGENIDWQNAPHHFEIWCLGNIEADGFIQTEKRLLNTLDSLIRKDLRHPNRRPREEESEIATGGRQGSPGVTREDPYPEGGPNADAPHADARAS